MLVGVYAIKDFRNGFSNPTFETNDATAMRNFANACLQSGSILNNFKEDFQLFKLATFDTELGIFSVADGEFKPICNATDFVRGDK